MNKAVFRSRWIVGGPLEIVSESCIWYVVHTEKPRFIAIFEEQPSRDARHAAGEPPNDYWDTVLRGVDWIDAEPGYGQSGALIREAAESLDAFLAPQAP